MLVLRVRDMRTMTAKAHDGGILLGDASKMGDRE
jgi:hypothetical protein